MSLQFEPEIVFPEDRYEAAVLFLAVMAYPEYGAGRLGQPGSEFAGALASLCLWSYSKSHGLKRLYEKRGDPLFKAPRKHEFQGSFERGVRRLHRRVAAYDLFGNHLMETFLRGERKHISVQNLLSRRERYWSEKFGLNRTGPPAEVGQKVRDIYRRAFRPSIPVIHMAHALNLVADKVIPTINGWDEREPWSTLIFNSDRWIWSAIDDAERWRSSTRRLNLDYINSTRLVALTAPTQPEKV